MQVRIPERREARWLQARITRRREARRLWRAVRKEYAECEAGSRPCRLDATGRIRLDVGILLRPRSDAAKRLLALLGLDSPQALLSLYAQDLRAVPGIGRVRTNRIPLLGVAVNKNNILALAAGLDEDKQLAVLQEMVKIEAQFWSTPQVTHYLAERRAGGLKEIPPALVARQKAVDMAVRDLLSRVPAIETIRLAGIGVGSADELIRTAGALRAQGRDVEICGLELNPQLAAEANAALREAGIRGQVVQGDMDRAEDLQRILESAPHLLIDHWAGCYDSLVIQQARYALIRRQAQTAILTAILTEEWGVGKMISGEMKRNLATMTALWHKLDEAGDGLSEDEGRIHFVYPSQLQLARRLHGKKLCPAPWVAALYGWLSTMLPARIAFGPVVIHFPDGQDALRVSAPYGATLQARTCRYSLATLRKAALSTGWYIAQEELTLFGAGAVLLLKQGPGDWPEHC